MALKPYRATAHWKRIRLQVLNRDAWTCAYCGDQAKQVDHVWPRSKGGEDTLDNLVAACERCNYAKRDKTDIDVHSKHSVFSKETSTPPDLVERISPIRTNQDKNGQKAPTKIKKELDSPFSAFDSTGAIENG
jgi:hypothetical protein